MRPRLLACALLPTTLAAPAAAIEQSGPGRFACTGLAGTSQGADILPLQPGGEVRIAFRMTKAHPYRRELAFVRFDGPGGPSRIAVGRAGTDRPRLYAAVRAPRSRLEDPIYYFPFRGTPEWILLRLRLDDRGMLTVRSNELERRFRWGTMSRATLGCEAGEWDIDVWPRTYVPEGTKKA